MATQLTTQIQRLFDQVVNQGDESILEELFAPSFVSHAPQGDITGVDGFRDYVRMWRTGFPDVHCDVIDPIEDGDRIAWRVRATGTHRGDAFGIAATGNHIDFDSMNHARAENGKFVEHWMLMDLTTMMQQLGAGQAADSLA